MNLKRAFEIVLELAKDNALDRDQAGEMCALGEYDEQQEALDMIENFAGSLTQETLSEIAA